MKSDFKKRPKVVFMSKLNGDLIQALGVLQIAVDGVGRLLVWMCYSAGETVL